MLRFSSVLLIIVLFQIFITKDLQAQFYYKDIWQQQQLKKEFTLLKNENLRTVSVKSFEDNGEPSDGFFLERRIDKAFTISETISRSSFMPQSILTSWFDESGRVNKSIDSSENSVSITDYSYDKKGKLINISSATREPGDSSSITEERTYIYDAAGKIEKMLRKKNGSDFSEVKFVLDEQGNVVEEEEDKGRKYYYYYDAKARLTDVVHYNALAKRLLPDYMFEYDSGGKMKQHISTSEGSNNYFIWRYTYNDFGLRATEAVYSKEKRLLGRIEYTYK